MTRVKICGITSGEDAAAAVEAGADALGFVFVPGTPRCLNPEVAERIVGVLPPFVTPVGVFVNQSEAEIRRAAEESGVRVLQLHGDEPPELCARLPLPVVKAVRVGAALPLDALRAYPVAAFLLDAPSAGHGGSGATFDWSLAEGVAGLGPLILAGGLTPENVAAAVRRVRPYAVDVASGVESAPGVKEVSKMARFIAAAREIA